LCGKPADNLMYCHFLYLVSVIILLYYFIKDNFVVLTDS